MVDRSLTTLTYNDAPIHLRGEALCLTDMWKAASRPEHREPFQWARKEGASFIEAISEMHNLPVGQVMTTKRGKGGATWAHWQIGFAYAKYLSPEFHAWCNTAAREKLEGAAKGHVVVASLDEEARSVIGGISRGIVLKAIAPLEERVTNLLAEVRSLIVTHQAGTAAITHKTALELLTDAGAHQKGRTGLVRKVSSALRQQAQLQGIALFQCARTKTWMFPVELSSPYMATVGAALVRLHNAQIEGGQQVIPFSGLRSRAVAKQTQADSALNSLADTVLPPERMDEGEIAHAIIHLAQGFQRYDSDPEFRRAMLRRGARAIMQMWGDLKQAPVTPRRPLSERIRDLEEHIGNQQLTDILSRSADILEAAARQRDGQVHPVA